MATVVTVQTPELGDRSYLAHDGDVALAVDPQRDVDRVLGAAEAAGVRIECVAETHLHNDYVSGGLELARRLRVDYLVAGADDVGFDRRPVAEGDEVGVGRMAVRVVSSPGHTANHLSYVVTEGGRASAVFTGGSLLFGTVGRTDLVDPAVTESLTRSQYHSVRRLLAELPGAVAVHPTHGFGSFCSSASPSGATESTIAAESEVNLAARAGDEDGFVATLLGGLTAYPRYYAHVGPINRSGPPPVDLSAPEPLDPDAVAGRARDGGWVVDLRSRRAFAAEHLAGTVGVELGTPFATYLGWVVPWGTPLTLVGDSPEEVAEARRALVRIGVDELAGAAAGGMAALRRAGSTSSYPVSDFAGLAAEGPRAQVLDVRRDDEWVVGHLKGATHVPLQDLEARMDGVPAGLVWVHCASGFRASIGASLLDRAGRDVVLVDDDWESAGAAGLEMVVDPS